MRLSSRAVETRVPAVPPERSPAAADPDGPLAVDDWPSLIARAGLGGPLGQLAQHAVLLGVDGNTLRLGMQSMHARLASPALVAQLEQRLGDALGRSLRVRFETVADTAESPADTRARASASRQQAAQDALHGDPVVQSLIDTFGARLIADSVRPLENKP